MKRLIAPIVFLGLGCAAQAVQIYGTDGLDHLGAPANTPGWANVGRVGGASFVYLGSYASGYWALSARHVVGDADALSLNLAGNTYDSVAGSSVRLLNGDSSPTDLMLFRITGDTALDALPNLTVTSTATSVGATIRYVGYGFQRAASPTYWSVTGTSPNFLWTEQPGPGGANARGYKWTASTARSWGDAVVSAEAAPVNIGNGPTAAFATTFAQSNGSAMLAIGDSGGAAFRQVNGVWELAGINDAIATFANQPANTSVVGNLAYAADLSVYSAQIRSVIAIPEPGAWAGAAAGAMAIAALRRRTKNKARLG